MVADTKFMNWDKKEMVESVSSFIQYACYSFILCATFRLFTSTQVAAVMSFFIVGIVRPILVQRFEKFKIGLWKVIKEG